VNNCHTVSMTGLFDKQEGCEGGVDVLHRYTVNLTPISTWVTFFANTVLYS